MEVDTYADLPAASPERHQRYTATAAAPADGFDDFGFNETTSEWSKRVMVA